MPQILHLLERFGTFSGYKLNLAKSECFPVNGLACQISSDLTHFKFCKYNFKYLGVKICSNMSDLYKYNFPFLISKLKMDLEKWNNLNITLTGRINSIKMNILPRFFISFPVLTGIPAL